MCTKDAAEALSKIDITITAVSPHTVLACKSALYESHFSCTFFHVLLLNADTTSFMCIYLQLKSCRPAFFLELKSQRNIYSQSTSNAGDALDRSQSTLRHPGINEVVRVLLRCFIRDMDVYPHHTSCSESFVACTLRAHLSSSKKLTTISHILFFCHTSPPPPLGTSHILGWLGWSGERSHIMSIRVK